MDNAITPSDSLVEQASQSPTAAAAKGLMQAIGGYLGGQLQSNQDLQTEAGKASIEVAKQAAIAKNNQAITNPPGGQNFIPMDLQLAEKALPGYGAKMVQEYNSRNPNNPLSLNDASDYISKAKAMLDAASPQRDDKYLANQDKLEKQAMDRITMVRGDQSLMRAEHQRDAAGMAYDTLTKAESENRPLTELEQTDLIGQLWQARTGKAPTDSDMKLLNDRTAKRGFNHMVTYLTGDPSIVGASTDQTQANLKQFVVSTGQKADQQWSGYMNPRLIKPTDLEQSRWDHIVSQQRGIPFSDQRKTSDVTYKKAAGVGGSSDIAAKKAALRAKLGL